MPAALVVVVVFALPAHAMQCHVPYNQFVVYLSDQITNKDVTVLKFVAYLSDHYDHYHYLDMSGLSDQYV